MKPLRVLLVEDSPGDAELLIRELRRGGYEPVVHRVETAEAMRAALDQQSWEIVLSDYALPHFSGLAALELLRKRDSDLPFILVSGNVGEDIAVEAMRLGAHDYLMKDRLQRLVPAVERELAEAEVRRERHLLEKEKDQLVHDLRRQIQHATLLQRVSRLLQEERPLRGLFQEIVSVIPDGSHHPEVAAARIRFASSEFTSAYYAESPWKLSASFTSQRGEGRCELVYLEERPERDEGPFLAEERTLLNSLADMLKSYLDRTATQEQLREAEARYRMLVEQIPALIYSMNFEGPPGLDYISPRAASLLGFSADEWRARPSLWLERVHPEDQERLLAETRRPHASGETILFEYRFLAKDGRTVWLHDEAVMVCDPAGRLRSLRGCALDITQQKQAEAYSAAFASLGQRLSAAASVGEAGEIVVEVADRLLGWDACWLDLHLPGQERLQSVLAKDVVGGRRADVPFSERPAQYTPLLRRVLAEGAQLILRSPGEADSPGLLRFGDVNRPSASIMVVPLRDGAQVIGVLSIQSYTFNAYTEADLGTLQSLADHCSAAIKQRLSDQQIRAQARLLDLASDAISVRDLEGRIQFWNHGAERLYGWTAAEATGRESSFLLQQDRATLDLARQTALAEGTWNGELRGTDKQGHEVVVSSRWTLVKEDEGHPQSVLVIDTDITARKVMEKQFLRAQRLESLGRMTGGIAHDLNNILTPILMWAPLLKDGTASPDELREALDTIEKSARRGADLIKQLLTFSRGSQGERVPVQVRALLRDMTKIAQETFPKSLTIRADVDGDLWSVTGDVTQLHQVLMNLCVNACDAMPKGGTLTLRAGNVTLGHDQAALLVGAKSGSYVRLEVEDTGQGIPPEVMERIFEPFFTTKPQGQGTGLGLATTLGIVRSHGGFLNVRSQPDEGTLFEVYLPASSQVETPGRAAPPAHLPLGQGELILLVDDEPGIRATMSMVLRRQNYQVVEAENGLQAVSLYEARTPEIRAVITDVMMPAMDGIALVRFLKRRNPKLPIIASTGLADMHNPGEALQKLSGLGVQWILNKPYPPNDLIQALQAVL